MSNVWFCSDFHLGHKGISKKFRTNFESDIEHNEILIQGYHKFVKKRDVVYMLGDMAFDIKYLQQIKTWPGIKKLVLGNHDFMRGKIKLSDMVDSYDEIHGCIKYKGLWLTHFPIHPNELYGKVNVHGHVHRNEISIIEDYNIHKDRRYINVCPESIGYEKPLLSLDEIKRIII